MITIIKAMQQVIGSEIILFGSLLCAAFFAFLFIVFKRNRNKRSMLIYFSAMSLSFEICDVIWLTYFFPHGEYVNRGLMPINIFLIFPLFCIVLNIFFTVFNGIKAKKI